MVQYFNIPNEKANKFTFLLNNLTIYNNVLIKYFALNFKLKLSEGKKSR